MNGDPCARRMRISIKGLADRQNQSLWRQLLLMVDGIFDVTCNPISERMLIYYDDRKLEAWQLSALTKKLQMRANAVLPATVYPLRRHQFFMSLPLVTLAAVGLRRLAFGRSQLTDNVILFHLAAILNALSGHPPLRAQVEKISRRIKISDDLLLSGAALVLAGLRESYLILLSLFVLGYSTYRRRHNTLSSLARAGEDIARLDSENEEPADIANFAARMSKRGLTVSLLASALKRDPRVGSSLLISANPRPLVVGLRYALNHAEILTHEDCRFIPIHRGMDLYTMPKAREIVIVSNQKNNVSKLDGASRALADQLGIQAVRYAEAAPSPISPESLNTGGSSLARIILLPPHSEPLHTYQRMGDTIYLQGSEEQLLETLRLGKSVRQFAHISKLTTEWFSVLLSAGVIFGIQPKRINESADLFMLLMLAFGSTRHG